MIPETSLFRAALCPCFQLFVLIPDTVSPLILSSVDKKPATDPRHFKCTSEPGSMANPFSDNKFFQARTSEIKSCPK
jgi:hypothetical protein